MDESIYIANILIVDDRPDKLLALETVLEGLRQNLVKVRSGDEALRQLLRQDFAVILLDVNMPGMDGFETAAMIRQRQRSEATPIIFISAMNDAENHVSRGYSLGAVDYILSPVVPEILRAKVSAFVDLYRKTQQIKKQAEEHAQLIQEQAARARAEAEKERMAFIAEASNVLAGSLDYTQTFTNLARLVVPRLAEFCLIDRVDEEGNLHQVAAAHCDPAKEDLLRQIRYPKAAESSHGAFRVYQTGAPFIENRINEKLISELLPEGDRPIARLLELTSFAVIPMMVRGQVVGTITMAHTKEGLSYGEDEVWLAGELANRTALALDNVELYRRANQAREEAEAANLSKDRFLAMLSHELRTPLTPVIAYLSKMAEEKAVPESLRHPLEVIRRNVELEARLIDDLLDLTRVGNGKIHLETRIVDAHDLLQNAIEICQPDLDAKKLTLRLDLAASHSRVRADPARLQQVFWNIIKNAVKFTWEGSIHISTRNIDEQLVISVRDTGIGMNKQLLARIFQPFEQAERGKQGGLGLGLAITKELVDLHEGEIEVESSGDGQGSTFIVQLPWTDECVEAPSPPVPKPAPEATPLRILLIEDHPDTNESLTLLLELRGYLVTSAFNVKSAIEIASRQDFDVLLSDLGLPDGNAGEAMKMVADRNSTVGIALSGFGMEKDFEISRSYGFHYHLVKPVDIGKLDQILQNMRDSKSCQVG